MADETQILRNRFKELNNRSRGRGIYTYSDFLNMYEQTVLCQELKFGYTLWGGYEEAERKIVCFGEESDLGYKPQPPISILTVAPLSEKFSDDLTHRDFLGSILGLGIKRETIGDIIISNNKGYVICLESISQYIIDNLTKVKHTSVYCDRCASLPSDALPKPTEQLVIVSSLRLDIIISGVYNLSRSKSSALVEGERVFINGKLTVNNSAPLKDGDTVSVRGIGRFRFKEIAGDTRKGRIRIICDIY